MGIRKDKSKIKHTEIRSIVLRRKIFSTYFRFKGRILRKKFINSGEFINILGQQSTELSLRIECAAVYVRTHLPIKLHDAPSRKRTNLTFTPVRKSNLKYRSTYDLARNMWHIGVNKVNDTLKIC